MRGPFFTVVIPTIGRPTLGRTLDSIPEGVDVIVVADTFEMDEGTQRMIRCHALAWGARYYAVDAGRHDTGSPQLAEGYRQAQGNWIMNLGDDDVYEPHAFKTIRRAIVNDVTTRPLMFRTVLHPAPHRGNELPVALWATPEITRGRITGQCFLTPNDQSKLGEWVDDVTFMQQTVERFGSVAWRTEVISQCY